MNYTEPIRIAILFFPFIALLISAPFILSQYHKFGSVSFFKSVIIYSFTLYFICAYFLIILPLPEINEVKAMTSPRMQLIPLKFISDFITNTSFSITNIHTYLKALKESYFLVPLYNIVLTIPFGIYLRYYFKCNIKKIILYTFLLSLFFELTQLSGLYFIYPRGYRLFDVDDLLLNTLGGLIGYYISKPIIKHLPTIEKVEKKAKEKGKKVTGFKRTTVFFFDLFLIGLIQMLLSIFIENKHIFEISVFIYYFIIPIFLNFSTLGEKFLNMKVLSIDDKNSVIRLFYRRILFLLIYIIIPYSIAFIIYNISIPINIKRIIGISYILVLFILYSVSIIKYLFTNKLMLYEKLSKTKLVSTIK